METHRDTPAHPRQRAERRVPGPHSRAVLVPFTALNTDRSERERPQVRREEVRKGGWVRTGESGVGLSEGRKGGLLHGQLVELGQLLG